MDRPICNAEIVMLWRGGRPTTDDPTKGRIVVKSILIIVKLYKGKFTTSRTAVSHAHDSLNLF